VWGYNPVFSGDIYLFPNQYVQRST
jgi:hypothetical protein